MPEISILFEVALGAFLMVLPSAFNMSQRWARAIFYFCGILAIFLGAWQVIDSKFPDQKTYPSPSLKTPESKRTVIMGIDPSEPCINAENTTNSGMDGIDLYGCNLDFKGSEDFHYRHGTVRP